MKKEKGDPREREREGEGERDLLIQALRYESSAFGQGEIV